jgi:hypothetical protein
MVARDPQIVRRDKAYSVTKRPGTFYTAFVTRAVGDGRVYVRVSELNTIYGPILPLNTTTGSFLSVGDSVVCTFTDEYFTKLIILGTIKVSSPVSVSLEGLSDVGLTVAPVDGQLLSYSSSASAWVAVSLSLDDISDVDLTVAPIDGQLLSYSSSASAWVAITPDPERPVDDADAVIAMRVFS